MIQIGKNIKELRIKKGITQLDLANILLVSDRTVSKWEQEKGYPDLEIIPKIADYFGVSIDYLFRGSNDNRYEKFYERSNDYSVVINYFNDAIKPLVLSEYCEREIERLLVDYSPYEIKQAIDTFHRHYLSRLDENEKNQIYLHNNIGKLRGILNNYSLCDFDRTVSHITNLIAKKEPSLSKFNIKNWIKKAVTISSLTDYQQLDVLETFKKYIINERPTFEDSKYYLISLIQHAVNQNAKKESNSDGFLKMRSYGPLDLTEDFKSFNQLLKQQEIQTLKRQIITILDKLLKNLLYCYDHGIDLNNVPHITKIHNSIYDIYDGFLGKKNSATIEKIFAKCRNSSSENELFMEDLDEFKKLINSIEKKIMIRINRNDSTYKVNLELLFNFNSK